MLELLKGKNKAVGAKQSLRAIDKHIAKAVFIAKDADERVVGSIKELCTRDSIEVVYADSMKQLGKACNLEVGCAVACLIKED